MINKTKKLEELESDMKDTREILKSFSPPPPPRNWKDLLTKTNINELTNTFILPPPNEKKIIPAYESEIKDEIYRNFFNLYFEFIIEKIPLVYLPVALPFLTSLLESWLNYRLGKKDLSLYDAIEEAQGKPKEAILSEKGAQYAHRLRNIRNKFVHFKIEELKENIWMKNAKDEIVKTLNMCWEPTIDGIKGFLIAGVDSEFLNYK